MSGIGAGGRAWAALALPDELDSAERAAFLDRTAGSGLHGHAVVVQTCHRVEWYGIGAPDGIVLDAPGVEVLTDGDAVTHLLRLAAGLESAVLGEEQVLAQVRAAHRAALRDGLDPSLDRLMQVSLRVGRAARAGGVPGEFRDLAALAVRRLEAMIGTLAGRRVLVVGSGSMGIGIVRAAAKHGARITVAGRDTARARQVARIAGGRSVNLVEGALLAGEADAVAVALGGPWDALPVDAVLPPTVDLSSPPAVPPSVIERLGTRFVDIDALATHATDGRGWEPDRAPDAGRRDEAERAYVERAERLVAAGVREYEAWCAARAAVETVRDLRTSAEERRAAEVERLLRRLPDLDDRERELVELMSRRIVGGLLHAPLARLRDRPDDADAVRRVFSL